MENTVQPGLIHKLIPKIMGEVGSISKKRQGQGSGVNYAFRGIDDVYLALQGPLSEHGVYYTPEVVDMKREERQSKTGTHLTITILTVRYTFYATDGSSVQSVVIGEAMDTSDKSCNKAMSAALKYALLQVFCIPTEEAKDTELEHHEPVPRQGNVINRAPTPLKTEKAPRYQGIHKPQIQTPEGSKALTAKQLQLIQFTKQKNKMDDARYLKIVQDVAGVGSDTQIPFAKVNEVLGALQKG